MEGTNEIQYVFWIGTGLMISLAFGLLLLALFYQNYAVKRKRKEAGLLLKATLDSEKNERKRIAADLHDSVQGDLNAIRNFLALAEKNKLPGQENELMPEARKAVEKVLENTRLISKKLIPPLLESSGIIAALSDHFGDISKASGKTFSVQSTVHDLSLSTNKSYELFRVLQEFTQNMLKHGNINECLVLFYAKDAEMTIEIVDDGIPYDFKTSYINSKGSGLRNIQSRVNSIDAQLIQRETVSGNHFVIHLKT
ncbi:MAG: histidine kinase [Flavobacteriaceae bacterium]|nr:histidine kinase [Flavobacteriaceae bacterium]